MAVTFTALGMTISKLTKALFTTGLDLGNTLQLIFAVLLSQEMSAQKLIQPD